MVVQQKSLENGLCPIVSKTTLPVGWLSFENEVLPPNVLGEDTLNQFTTMVSNSPGVELPYNEPIFLYEQKLTETIQTLVTSKELATVKGSVTPKESVSAGPTTKS